MHSDSNKPNFSDLIAQLFHDIRTCLNGLIGTVDLFERDNLNSSQLEQLFIIQESAQTINIMLTEALDFSKLETSKFIIRKNAIEIREIVKYVANLFKHLAQSKNVEINFFITENVPDKLLGDEIRIKQILSNLVLNAIKATKEGRIDIFVTQKSDDMIFFSIKDSGIGISSKQIHSLFKPYVQLSVEEGLSKISGSGLGLYLCKKLCKMMEGEIGVFSEPNRGSEFWFTLKLPECPLNPQTDRKIRKVQPKQLKKVLIVDDNIINQKLMLKMVKKIGYEGEIASTGKKALDAIKSGGFAAVLMDCQMPHMDGLKTTKLTRKLQRPLCDIPIIAMTAGDEELEKQKCVAAGMNEFIAKPIHIEQVRSILAKLLG